MFFRTGYLIRLQHQVTAKIRLGNATNSKKTGALWEADIGTAARNTVRAVCSSCR